MKIALDVQGLYKKYELFELKDACFQIPVGSIMGLVGPNGSGKTTIIKSILSLVNYNSGQITFFGESLRKGDLFKDLGVVADFSIYDKAWRLKDVEKMYAYFYDNWDSEVFQDLLTKFGISIKKRVGELSRGMNVKLMIATAFARKARLLILDEPTSGLDPVARHEICNLLNAYVAIENGSVLFSTHHTTDLEYAAEYVTMLSKGSVTYTGKISSLMETYSIISGIPEKAVQKRNLIKGYIEHEGTFKGMINRADAENVPHDTIRPATIDDIVVYSYEA